MKYIIELDEQVFEYMKEQDGSVERYFKNRVLKPIWKAIESYEKIKAVKVEEKQINKKLKELKKTVNIKLEVQRVINEMPSAKEI